MLLQVKYSKGMQFWEQKKSEKNTVIMKCIHTDTKLARRTIVQLYLDGFGPIIVLVTSKIMRSYYNIDIVYYTIQSCIG